jgi:hypothetical protein
MLKQDATTKEIHTDLVILGQSFFRTITGSIWGTGARHMGHVSSDPRT